MQAEVAGVEGPLLTYCDEATGERVELTATELGGWAARTAMLLREGCGLGAGDRIAVLLPPHWQTAAVLLGAWSMGVSVEFRPWATAGLGTPDDEEPFDAVFVSRQRLDSWLETVPTARHSFVVGESSEGYRDYLAEVGQYSGSLLAYGSISGPASPDGTTYRQWGDVALGFAAELGLHAGDRLLVDVAQREQPVMWLLAPLSVGATVVLCANLDRDTLDDRIAAEGVTHVLA